MTLMPESPRRGTMGGVTTASPELPAPRRVPSAVPVLLAGAGAVACTLVAAAPALRGVDYNVTATTVRVTVATCFIGAALVAVLRRPANRTWLLLAAVGFLWLVQDLSWLPGALPFTIAATYERLYEPVLAHLVLAFPHGRLPGRRERIVIAIAYVWTLLNNPARMLVYDPAVDCRRCPDNLLLVGQHRDVWRDINDVTSVVSVVVIVSVVAVIVRHWIVATRAARHVMAPALWAAGPAAAYLVGIEIADLVDLGGGAGRFVYEVLPLGLAVLPIGFLLSILRTRLSYAEVGGLLSELGGGGVAPGRVREVLARVLHDPSLELRYWSPSTRGYVDADGVPAPSDAGRGRTARRVDGESGPLALVVVDEAALHEPGLVDAAGAMVRLALENERLQAEVRSQLVQLRSATARLVKAGDEARRRLERDLHDGAQQRLLALAMNLGRARSRLNGETDPQVEEFLALSAADLQEAITELRELARGIHPVLLTQEGLASALHALADRSPLPVVVTADTERCEPSVESAAYFLVSEAVTNAARHSAASRVQVGVRREGAALIVSIADDGIGGAAVGGGTGLQGMQDRSVAAGGTFRLTSEPGAGTVVEASLPCG
jgi:signal transduction histidine kinase